jgi:hypothetical protein
MNIAPEVLQQLGGQKFLVMTGTKPQYFDDKNNSVMFRLIRNKSKANYMKIKLDWTDTYTVEFIKANESKVEIVETRTGVYNDMLQELFTEVTGLYTKLF